MGFAIELNLDQASAARVVELWRELKRNSLPSLMLELGVHPHISLAVFTDLNPAALRDDLAMFASSTPPLTLRFSSVGVFPTAESVVFLAPVVTEELLQVHRRLHQLLYRRRLEAIEYYRPGRWVPHCTVDMELPGDLVGRAVEVCWESNVFVDVNLDSLGMIEFRPVKELYRFVLDD